MRHADSIVLALLLLACGRAAAFDWSLHGYVKDTPVYIGEVDYAFGGISSDATWLNSTRTRLKARVLPVESLTLAVDYDIEGVYGRNVGTTGGYALAGDDNGVADLSWKMIGRDRFVAHHRIDRFYAQYYSDYAVLTLGRQRVAWGVTSFFSPLDRFAPFAATAIDKDEKTGVDAVKISIPWGMLSNFEAIYSPTNDRDVYNAGVRIRTNLAGWDVGIMGGEFHHDWLVGTSVSGDVYEAALKAEMAVVEGERTAANLYIIKGSSSPFYMCSSDRGRYIQAAVSAEYGFAWRNLTVQAEGFYDGTGQSDRNLYAPEMFVPYWWTGERPAPRTTLAQLYGAGTASVLLHPLVTFSVAGIVNANDGSWFTSPNIEWSVSENLILRFGYQYYAGSVGSVSGYPTTKLFTEEFALSPDMAYAILALHF